MFNKYSKTDRQPS